MDRLKKLTGLAEIGENLLAQAVVPAMLLLVGVSGFGLGRLSLLEGEKTPIQIEYPALVTSTSSMQTSSPATAEKAGKESAVQKNTATSTTTSVSTGGQLVGSKTGKKYYFPWCSAANRIKEANRRWFASEKEARALGYTPAANCKGLK